MTFAARPLVATGAFASVGMATPFAAGANSGSGTGGTISLWQWTINPDGTITPTIQFNPTTSNTRSASWGTPAASGEGVNWEAQFQLTSGNIAYAAGGSAGIDILGVSISAAGAIAPQTTPWYTLSSPQSIDGSVGSTVLGGSASLNFAGTLSIRNKLTQQLIQQSVSMNLTY